MTSIFELVKDPYERRARVTPGLLVALPLLVPLIATYGKNNSVLTGLLVLLGGCGAIYALASITRGLGKKLEVKLVKIWGGMPTTIALRHRDPFIDRTSKLIYHQLITEKLNILLPTKEEEAAAPDQADDAYIGATRRLRERTRTDKQLLLKENIAYGFHRNMLAMKGIGMFTCFLGIIYSLLLGKIIQFDKPNFILANFADLGIAAGVTFLISITLLATWIFYFDQEAVKRIGFVYAERLFECLHSLTIKS